MLVTSLLPLLVRYSLGLDMVAGPDETVTLTIIPRKAGPKSAALDGSETRPISITASAEEIDAELARGANGALGHIGKQGRSGAAGDVHIVNGFDVWENLRCCRHQHGACVFTWHGAAKDDA